MKTYNDVLNFVEEENVKFIRLAFFDIYGTQKNIAIMPEELKRAFTEGISFDASAIAGFGSVEQSDLYLIPDASTLSIVPWRPMDGRVARMFCDVTYPDGTLFEHDSRYLLKKAVKEAKDQGFSLNFGAEVEFYLFQTDEHGLPTKTPFDHAGYMDIAPEDRGENIRREIEFALIDMGIRPESSHHEQGPGQNEIDFRYTDALTAADHTSTFKWVVKSIAMANGAWADFTPKPIPMEAGNGMHVNISIENVDGKDYTNQFLAGILEHIKEITMFLNPVEGSYQRLGEMKAPHYISWSEQNRSQLVRIPATRSTRKRLELRSPDCMANPYLAYAFLIHAGLDGIRRNLTLCDPVNVNLFTADEALLSKLDTLPCDLKEAIDEAANSLFVKNIISSEIIDYYRNRLSKDESASDLTYHD